MFKSYDERREDIIKSIMQNKLENGITFEQNFLIEYFNLDKDEIPNKEFNFSNFNTDALGFKEISEDELEAKRYKILIDLEFLVGNIHNKNKPIDIFHKEIIDKEGYTKDIDENALIIKKMRNLQLINRVAHEYEVKFKSIAMGIVNKLKEVDEIEKIKILSKTEDLFSKMPEDVIEAEESLKTLLENEDVVEDLKNNKQLKFCQESKIWMFNQKNEYIEEILKELQYEELQYNYGYLFNEWGVGIIFDVPQYGQFGVHLGKHTYKIEDFKKNYGLEKYNGIHLGNVFILSKADKEMLEKADFSELSNYEKYRYKILSQKEEKAINCDDILKQYKIRGQNPRNFNINSRVLRKNIELSIESGLYDLIRQGENEFLKIPNNELNMKINLLNNYGVDLTLNRDGKTIINPMVFYSEEDLRKEFIINRDSNELQKLSRNQGQELIKENIFKNKANIWEYKDLNYKQKKLTNYIYNHLRKYEDENSVLLKIGEYNYSTKKVKDSIVNIVCQKRLERLNNREKLQLIQAALLTDKNISKDELEFVSSRIEKEDSKFIVKNNIQTMRQELDELNKRISETSKQLNRARDTRQKLRQNKNQINKQIPNSNGRY